MRRLALAVALLVGSACRPGDHQSWVELYERAPKLAMGHLREKHPRMWARINTPAVWRPDTACSQWAQLALDAGWSKDEWVNPMSWIMYRESRCNPGATSSAGARGLMQIMPFWTSHCGGGSLYDPAFNLRCARYVRSQQGWSAWDVY